MEDKNWLMDQLRRILEAATARELDLIYRFARGLIRSGKTYENLRF